MPTMLCRVLTTALLAGLACAADRPLFTDVTTQVGLADIPAARVSFADFNGDGYPDVIAACSQIYLKVPADPNDPTAGRRFTRSNHDGPLAATATRQPACCQVGDLNGDGYADLFIGFHTLVDPNTRDPNLPGNEIWLADPDGRFTRVNESVVSGHREATISACLLDYDRDGHVDLFVGNAYAAPGTLVAAPDRLYRGHGDGTFTEVTESAGLLGTPDTGQPTSRRPTYGVTSADYNNDGWPDLLVMTYGRQANRLWRNNGDGTFTDVAPRTHFDGDSDRSGKYSDEVKARFREQYDPNFDDEPPWRSHGNTFDAAVADFDNDGDLDCFLAEITHAWAGPSSDLSMLLVNRGPQHDYAFERDPNRIPPRPRDGRFWNQGDLHAGWIDVDNDGRLDLLIASSDYPDEQILRLYHQEPGGRFAEWTDRLGFRWMNASQLALADFDGDGATDILVGTNQMRLTRAQRENHSPNLALFRNVAAPRSGHHWLSLRLRGQSLGARVTVTCGETTQIREVSGGLGHAGHRDDLECRFGLGSAARVDRLEVRWPDAAGTTQTFESVKPDQRYTLRKGGQLQ